MLCGMLPKVQGPWGPLEIHWDTNLRSTAELPFWKLELGRRVSGRQFPNPKGRGSSLPGSSIKQGIEIPALKQDRGHSYRKLPLFIADNRHALKTTAWRQPEEKTGG